MNYPHPYDEPYVEMECASCDEKDEALEGIKDWFDELVGFVYSKDRFSAEDFEICLDEIAHCLDKKLPDGEVQLSRKNAEDNEKVTKMLESWKLANNNYLSNLTYKRSYQNESIRTN